MDSTRQYLFDTLVEEFNKKQSFLLARTLFLFCNFNPSFEMPADIHNAFIKGLLEDEVRAFSLRYPVKDPEGSARKSDEETAALDELKLDIHKQIAAENLSKGTGKMYTSTMIEHAVRKYRSVLSYNEILEIIILSAHKKI